MNKTSLRFFGDIPVRSVWDDDTSKWWLCASDVVAALAETINPRIFWATIKRRNPQLFANCKQLKMIARDGKSLYGRLSTVRWFSNTPHLCECVKRTLFNACRWHMERQMDY